ncbi:unnamed protein product [Symbiodinium natans]|uniref:Uncharacterized protein n=1 Tax=Symbiodinium natans TaxID=878477 RepID=A0A812K4M7_9DINO|nr:unnamed protein product [Symbiodinium natans]
MEIRSSAPTQRVKQRGELDVTEDVPQLKKWAALQKRVCGACGLRAALLCCLLLIFTAGVQQLVHEKFKFETLYPDFEAGTASCDKAKAPPEALRLGGILSFFSQDGLSVGLTSLWPRIANATQANHQAFASLLGVPYKQVTSGHRRCGKMRAVAEALKCIAPGTWLFFIDADAAFKASVTPCAPAPSLSPMHCDALAWHGNTTQGRGKCPSSIRALAAFHGNVFRYSGRDPSLLNLWPFGLFAVRHDAFGLDWLERVASRLESELLLCRLSSIPERKAAFWVTTPADKCKIWPNDQWFSSYFLHLTSGTEENIKGDAARTEAFLEMVERESRALEAAMAR